MFGKAFSNRRLSMLVLVGILAGSDNVDRARMTSLRNFLRDIGAAIGTTGKLMNIHTIMELEFREF